MRSMVRWQCRDGNCITLICLIITCCADTILRCANDIQTVGFLTRPTLAAVENGISFDNGILYAILHEPIYCQG